MACCETTWFALETIIIQCGKSYWPANWHGVFFVHGSCVHRYWMKAKVKALLSRWKSKGCVRGQLWNQGSGLWKLLVEGWIQVIVRLKGVGCSVHSSSLFTQGKPSRHPCVISLVGRVFLHFVQSSLLEQHTRGWANQFERLGQSGLPIFSF